MLDYQSINFAKLKRQKQQQKWLRLSIHLSSVILLVATLERFYRSKLAKAKITPNDSAITNPTVDICSPTDAVKQRKPTPPTVDPVAQCIKRRRMSLGTEMMADKQAKS
jgi:hypothetical protein